MKKFFPYIIHDVGANQYAAIPGFTIQNDFLRFVSRLKTLSWKIRGILSDMRWFKKKNRSGLKGKPPLVSVIIPCFNHGQYLSNAIKSVLQLEYPNIEIIVVDDGSTDNTQEVLNGLTDVKNIYQENKGLSAARNTGIANSSGEFLIFLDADDWLLTDAISTNLNYLYWNKQIAFVSGAHEKHFIDNDEIKVVSQVVKRAHYWHLLHGNYIGMHATVMFRRWVFDTFSYDTSLKACEDYDLYLKIARKFPVFHHTHKIAAYRIHDKNMSGNKQLMLATVLKVLQRQEAGLQTELELEAYKKGVDTFKTYYS